MSSPDVHAVLHPISCERCRRKKIRCDRIKPACAHCASTHSDCQYPSRKRRVVKRETILSHRIRQPITSDSSNHDPTDQVDQDDFVRKQCQVLTLFNACTSVNVKPITSIQDNSAYKPSSVAHLSVPFSRVNESTSNLQPSFPLLELELYRLKSGLYLPGFAYEMHEKMPELLDELSLSSLKPVWDSYRALVEVHASTNVSVGTSRPTGPLTHISKAFAKQLLTEYFEAVNVFDDFIDKPFLMLIPDLLERPHFVTISPAVLIVYYGILYWVLLLTPEQAIRLQSEFSDSRHVCFTLYETCIQLAGKWQKERSSSNVLTTVDFGAAFTLAWLGIENVDWSLAWEYFRLAYDFARHLGFLDDFFGPSPAPNTSERPYMVSLQESLFKTNNGKLNHLAQQDLYCSLLELEYFFRNFHGMPKVIQRSEYGALRYPMQEFVKRLNQVPELAEEVVRTAHARAMVLQSMILNDHDSSTIPEDQEIRESLVSEMLQIDQEFQLRDRFNKSTWNDGKWLYADALLNVYTSINFIYKPGITKPTRTKFRPSPEGQMRSAVDTLVVLKTIVTEMNDLTQKGHPWCDHFMSTHGAVAYSTLFNSLLAGTAGSYNIQATQHIDLMLWYQQTLSILVRDSKKMMDLERWAMTLNEFGQRVIGTKMLSSSAMIPSASSTLENYTIDTRPVTVVDNDDDNSDGTIQTVDQGQGTSFELPSADAVSENDLLNSSFDVLFGGMEEDIDFSWDPSFLVT